MWGVGLKKFVHWGTNLLFVALPLSPRLHGVPFHKMIIVHLSSQLQTQWAPRRGYAEARRGYAEARRGYAEVTTAV
jgi:hypothetical protein